MRPGQMHSAAFWPVIPAGGVGARLWPLSRATRPKFLLPLLGERSLIQATYDRLARLAPPERMLVISGTAHAAHIVRQLPELPPESMVVEPSPKGSGPAIALAAAIIATRDPDAVMGSFAADHAIQDENAFVAAVGAAIAAAVLGWFATIGLPPTRPETGYGYIERTDDLAPFPGGVPVYRASRFVEKPDRERAEEYLDSGRYLWNASMFFWRVGNFLEILAHLQPALHAGVTTIAAAWGTPDQERVLAETWPGLPEVTIDEGVMEEVDEFAVVPAEMGWSDVGEWHGLGDLIPRDDSGLRARGDALAVDSRGSVVWSETDRLIALVGMEDTVVVDTPDALLVVHRSRAQDVREIVSQLKSVGRDGLV